MMSCIITYFLNDTMSNLLFYCHIISCWKKTDFLWEFFLHFSACLFRYAFETNLRFVCFIPEIYRSSHNVWDCALCDII